MRAPLDNQLIWRYLDDQCTKEEKEKVEARLNEDQVARQQLSDIQLVHDALILSSTPKIEIDLQEKVLAQLQVQPARSVYSGINYKPFWIFLCFIVFALYVPFRETELFTFDWKRIFENPMVAAIPEITIDLPTIGSSGYFIALALIAIPSLYFLDKFLQKQKVRGTGMLLA